MASRRAALAWARKDAIRARIGSHFDDVRGIEADLLGSFEGLRFVVAVDDVEPDQPLLRLDVGPVRNFVRPRPGPHAVEPRQDAGRFFRALLVALVSA